MKQSEYHELIKNGGGRSPRKPRRQEEHNHQVAYFQILKLNLWKFPELEFIFAVPNAAKRSPQIAAYMLAEGLVAGVPAIIVPMPRHTYHGAFIENKIGNNKMQPEQLKFRDFLIKEGYFVKACYSVTEQVKTLEWYLNIELSK